MSKMTEAKTILNELGMPLKQQADLCCFVLLAMANIKESDSWSIATNRWIRIHDIIAYTKENYGIAYAENSRETFRKQAIHPRGFQRHLHGRRKFGFRICPII